MSAPAVERFMAKVDTSGDCWEWQACIDTTGYGRFAYEGGRVGSAHRFSYELALGPIPDGLQIDHLCRNRACVRPSHLEAVTQRENLLRGDTLVAANARKTHCMHGHEFTKENTRITALGNRQCKACRRKGASS